MPTQPGFRYRRSAVTEARHGQQRVVAVKRRPRRKVIGTLVVIILLVPAGLLATKSLWGVMTGTVPDPERVAQASGPPSPSLDPNDPFDGTPAVNFVPATQGIRLPTATKVGGWAAKDVQTVLRTTKAIVLGARTDPAVLGGDTTSYVKTLAPNARSAARKSIGSAPDTLGYVSRLAPGYTLAAPIRAAGTLVVKTGSLKQLVVTADVVWVYPLDGPLAEGSTGAGVRLAVLHTVESYEWYPSKGFADEDQGARPGEGKRKVFNADCQRYLEGSLALPSTPVRDPIKGNEAVFTPTTQLAVFPSDC